MIERRFATLYHDGTYSVLEPGKAEDEAIAFYREEDPNEPRPDFRPKLVEIAIEISRIVIDPVFEARVASNEALYLIWSNERGAWRHLNSCGFTREIDQALRFSRQRALEICKNACNGWREGFPPPEIPVAEADALLCDLTKGPHAC